MSLLSVKDLSIDFLSKKSVFSAVKNVSFDLKAGETLGLVGESGSGKSVTALACMRLLQEPPARYTNGEICFNGENLLEYKDSQMQKIRGHEVSMIFQEPMTSLNPVLTIGFQVSEVLRLHLGMSVGEAMTRSKQLLEQVEIPNAAQKLKCYPHELSGGQKQRVMIAIAIACSPKVLIADEPTTALDVTVQKKILELLADLQKQNGMSILFISHDLGVVADIADNVMVMYKGEIVESKSCHDIFKSPEHPYTKGLLHCRPRLDANPRRLATVSDFMNGIKKDESTREHRPFTESNPVLLNVKGLKTHFPVRSSFWRRSTEFIKAVDGVSLRVRKGRTLGLVGESGCGKSTFGRSVLRLIEPSSGEVLYEGQDILKLKSKPLRKLRKKIQIIFQDPYASLNPRMRVGDAIVEPMKIHGLYSNQNERLERAKYLLDKVGLEEEALERFPHEFSGGQRQRICIARALAVEPEFILCDEAVSALDVSVQAQVLNLLLDLQDEFGLTYIFISHDLAVVKFMSDDVAVMNNGKIVEYGYASSIYANPQDDYTKKLLAAIPRGL